jgi:hypothetical protein
LPSSGNDVISNFEADRDITKLDGQSYIVVESANGNAILKLSGARAE